MSGGDDRPSEKLPPDPSFGKKPHFSFKEPPELPGARFEAVSLPL